MTTIHHVGRVEKIKAFPLELNNLFHKTLVCSYGRYLIL